MAAFHWKQGVSFLTLLVAGYILWRIRQLLLLVFLAILIATLLNRIVQGLTRRSWRRGLAVAAVILGSLLTLGVLITAIAPPFIEQLGQLTTLAPQGIEQVERWSDRLRNLSPQLFSRNFEDIRSWFENLRSFNFQTIVGQFFSFFSNTLSITLNLLLVVVLSIMFLAAPQPYRKAALRLFPASHRSHIDQIFNDCESSIVGWFSGILFNMAVITVLSGLGLWILGVPLAFANALLAGMLTFIPNIGPVLSVIPPVAIALLSSPLKALLVVVLYFVIQQVEGNLLTPLVMQKQVDLLPALTLLSQILFATLFGFLGLFLALPLALVIYVWIEALWIQPVLDQS